MPTRSLRSSVLKWPDRASVLASLAEWCERVKQARKDAVRIGYFGSYAAGNEGVGSDLDLIVVIEESDLPRYKRITEWDTSEIPVPVDLLIFTREEFEKLCQSSSRFADETRQRTVWLYGDGGTADPRINHRDGSLYKNEF